MTQAPDRDALSEAEAAQRCGRLSSVRYQIHLDLTAAGSTYVGQSTIRFRDHAPGRPLFFDFTRKEILAAKLNGVDLLAFGIHPFRLELPPGAQRQDNEFEVRWRNDFDRTGVGLHRFQDPEDDEVYLFTDFEPFNAHRVFPCFDQPDLKAVYALSVDAPAHWITIANGAETHRVSLPDGRVRRSFATLPPFSTYLFALIAGPYVSETTVREGVPLGIHCRRSLRRFLDPEEMFDVTAQGLRFYAEQFGIAYPFGKYDQIFVPEFNSGAMENIGAVTFNESQVFRDPPTESQRLRRAEVILHELAHMWFGNLVTMRWWNGLWLNESFATYIAFLAMTEATRFQSAWQDFLGAIKGWAYREDQKPTTHPIAGTVDDTEQTFLNFDGITYGKGAAVLKQLRAVLGENAFRDGLRLYFARYAYGNTDLEDFLGALGEAAGRSLAPWAKLWLETSGVNVLRPEVRGQGAWSIRQEAGNGDRVLRPHKIEVAALREKPPHLVVERSFPVEVEAATTALPPGHYSALYCNFGDHAYAKAYLDEQSLATLRQGLSRVEDALLRMGLWSTFWEMTRDGVLPAAHYLALLADHLSAEKELDILETALRNAAVALSRWILLEHQERESAPLLRLCQAGIERHGPTSDVGLTYARHAPSFVASAAQAQNLLAWLDRPGPAALVPDQGLRWRILTRATAFGLAGADERVRAELLRDPSDRGKKAAFIAEVAAPEVATKETAFARFCTPGETSADFLKHGMTGFFWPHQTPMLTSFATRYLDSLPSVLEKEDLEYVARGYVRLLYPHCLPSAPLVAQGRAILASHGEKNPVLRRFLLEEVDEMERSLRLRGQA